MRKPARRAGEEYAAAEGRVIVGKRPACRPRAPPRHAPAKPTDYWTAGVALKPENLPRSAVSGTSQIVVTAPVEPVRVDPKAVSSAGKPNMRLFGYQTPPSEGRRVRGPPGGLRRRRLGRPRCPGAGRRGAALCGVAVLREGLRRGVQTKLFAFDPRSALCRRSKITSPRSLAVGPSVILGNPRRSRRSVRRSLQPRSPDHARRRQLDEGAVESRRSCSARPRGSRWSRGGRESGWRRWP